jgi:hypothetical protein
MILYLLESFETRVFCKKERGPNTMQIQMIVLWALSNILLQSGISMTTHDRGVAKGTWGGEHLILEISEKGAEAEFDCARGQITQPITLDKHGNFDIPGTFTPEHGGPVRRDENTPPAPVRYSGHVADDTMNLVITRGEEELGRFSLAHGAHPMLRKCR